MTEPTEINIFSIILRKRLIYFKYNDIFIFIRVFIANPALSVTSIIIILNSTPVSIRAEYSIFLFTVTGIIGITVIKNRYLIVVIE